MALVPTNPQQEVAYKDLCKLLADHSAGMTPLEMLAVAANMLGKLLAMQDQSKVTVPQAMEVIAKNIETGNQQVVRQLAHGPSAGSA